MRYRSGLVVALTFLGVIGLALSPAPGQDDEMQMLDKFRFDNDWFREDAKKLYLQQKEGELVNLREQLDVVKAIADRQRRELARATSVRDAMNEQLSKIGAGGAFETIGENLATQKSSLEIELVGLKAQQKVLLELSGKKARTGKAAEMKKLSLLEQMLRQKVEKLEYAKKLHEKGLVSESQVRNDQAEVTRAEIEMIEHKQKMDDGTSSDQSLVSQVQSVSISIAKISAQLNHVDERLELWNQLSSVHIKKRQYDGELIPLHQKQIQVLEAEALRLEQQIEVNAIKMSRKKKQMLKYAAEQNEKKPESQGGSDSAKDKK